MKAESKLLTRRYFMVSLLLMLLSNRALFDGARLLNESLRHWDLRLPLDAAVPFLPWMIAVYTGCNFWWFFVYWIIAQQGREDADRFFSANLLAKAVSFLIFVFFPTAVTRPELGGGSLWDSMLRILYALDKPDNVFPSIHCVLGWSCWIGFRGKKDVPFLLRAVSLLMALAVCFSTMAIRQHVMLDVVGGILLSEICFLCAGVDKIRHVYSSLADSLLHGLKKTEEKLFS